VSLVLTLLGLLGQVLGPAVLRVLLLGEFESLHGVATDEEGDLGASGDESSAVGSGAKRGKVGADIWQGMRAYYKETSLAHVYIHAKDGKCCCTLARCNSHQHPESASTLSQFRCCPKWHMIMACAPHSTSNMDCRSRRNTLPWLRMRMQGECRFTCLAVSPRPLSPSSGSLAGRRREVEKGQGRRQREEEAHIGSGRVGRCVGKERGWRWHQFSDWSCKQKEIEAYAGKWRQAICRQRNLRIIDASPDPGATPRQRIKLVRPGSRCEQAKMEEFS
jgi:hypothetical protein